MDISRESFDCLTDYQNLLLKWNATVNLISKNSEKIIWDRHILDSLKLYNMLIDNDYKIFDFGSGAGLPGIPLAICGIQNITLVERDKKKAAFLRHAQSSLKLSCNISNDCLSNIELCDNDCIISRATMSVEQVCDFFTKINFRGVCLLLKGTNVAQEIDMARRAWSFEHTNYPNGVLKISEIKSK